MSQNSWGESIPMSNNINLKIVEINLHPFLLEEQQQIKYAMYIIGFQKMKALEFLANIICIGALSLPNVEEPTSKVNKLT